MATPQHPPATGDAETDDDSSSSADDLAARCAELFKRIDEHLEGQSE